MAEQAAVNRQVVAWVVSCVESENLYWAAGLLEGEGSFQVSSSTSTPFISCGMTDLDVLERLQEILGGNLYGPFQGRDHHKPSWTWMLKGRASVSVMELLKPLMGSRRQSQIDHSLSTWGAKQQEINERSEARVANVEAAVQYYLSMSVRSMRKAAKKFGVSHNTIRNNLKLLK